MEQGSDVSVGSTVETVASVEVASTSTSVGISVAAGVAGGFPQPVRTMIKINSTRWLRRLFFIVDFPLLLILLSDLTQLRSEAVYPKGHDVRPPYYQGIAGSHIIPEWGDPARALG